MPTRRQTLKLLLTLGAGALTFFGQVGGGVRPAWAAAKRRILEKGTPMSELMHANPARLDTRNLETTPMSEFDVMGETIYPVDIEQWRLEIRGAVRHPARFNYDQLIQRPVLERNVLLVCPGFFAYNGRWKGFSVADLLSEIGLSPGATHVKFSGAKGLGRKTRKYTIEEVMANKVFIAYGVNGQTLPERHGYPMRLVAQDHKGGRWVKYLNRVTVVD